MSWTRGSASSDPWIASTIFTSSGKPKSSETRWENIATPGRAPLHDPGDEAPMGRRPEIDVPVSVGVYVLGIVRSDGRMVHDQGVKGGGLIAYLILTGVDYRHRGRLSGLSRQWHGIGQRLRPLRIGSGTELVDLGEGQDVVDTHADIGLEPELIDHIGRIEVVVESDPVDPELFAHHLGLAALPIGQQPAQFPSGRVSRGGEDLPGPVERQPLVSARSDLFVAEQPALINRPLQLGDPRPDHRSAVVGGRLYPRVPLRHLFLPFSNSATDEP